MIDTHCHLTSRGLAERVDAVVEAAHAAGVDRMITVATNEADARGAIQLAKRYPGVFATVGIHPHEAQAWQDTDPLAALFTELHNHPGVVAYGEMGLDWHYDNPQPAVQRRCFALQLQWIAEQASATDSKPIIIHNREATDDTLAMIADSGLPGSRFVFHCFTGDASELERILSIGASVSFTGIVTFKNSQALAAASDLVPIERLMIETDSPYLTPEPNRKVRPNEPQYVGLVAAFLASRRGMSMDDLVMRVDANAQRFFGLESIA